MKYNKRSNIYNQIKIIITILVIVGHIARMYTNQGAINVQTESLLLAKICNFIYGFHMPLYFFISGAIYHLCIYELEKYKDKIKYVKNKTKRLIIPYFIFGLFYVTPTMYLLNLTNDNLITYVLKNILFCQDSRHLWFLYYLFIYFMITYFILKNSDKLNKLIPTTLILFLISIMNIPMISNYTLYYMFFLLGFAIDKYFNKIQNFINTHKVISRTLLSILLFIYILLLNNNIHMTLINIVGTFLFFGIFILIPIQNNAIFNFIKKYSMGIYLFHPMIIYIIFSYFQININPIIFCLIVFVITTSISIFLTFIAKSLKLSFILGEKG